MGGLYWSQKKWDENTRANLLKSLPSPKLFIHLKNVQVERTELKVCSVRMGFASPSWLLSSLTALLPEYSGDFLWRNTTCSQLLCRVNAHSWVPADRSTTGLQIHHWAVCFYTHQVPWNHTTRAPFCSCHCHTNRCRVVSFTLPGWVCMYIYIPGHESILLLYNGVILSITINNCSPSFLLWLQYITVFACLW